MSLLHRTVVPTHFIPTHSLGCLRCAILDRVYPFSFSLLDIWLQHEQQFSKVLVLFLLKIIENVESVSNRLPGL